MRKVLAWVMLGGCSLGLVLSLPPWRLIAKQEPLTVLMLSWFALVYEGFNAVQIAHDKERK